MTYRRGKCGSSNRFSLLGSKITADGDYSHEIRRQLFLGRKIVTNLNSVLKNKDIILPNKSPYSQGCGLSTSHVWMWMQNHKEGRVLKSWCFPIVVLEKTLESPLNFKEIKPVNLKENQPWILFGKTDAEAETPILWPLDANSWLIGKYPDSGKDWRQEKKKATTKDEMVGWHLWLKWHELGKLWEVVRDREVWCAAVHALAKSQK